MLVALMIVALAPASSYSRLPFFPIAYQGDFFLATPLEVTSESFRNVTDPVNTIDFSRIDRGLMSRQACTKSGYSICQGYDTQCCPSGGTCCIRQSVVAGEPGNVGVC